MISKEDQEWFQKELNNANHITVLTGAGVSAESGIPTFRGKGGLWRTYSAMDLANPDAWKKDPALVWEFYNYRRALMLDKKPNPAHYALARLEEWCEKKGKGFDLITQNIDDLHLEAGTKRLIRLHGSLWLVRCTNCHKVFENRDVPITPAFEGSGAPEPGTPKRKFNEIDLPHCSDCRGVLRPHVVWFGESLDMEILRQAVEAVEKADFFIVVGTSALVYPAAGLIQSAGLNNQKKVVEINLEPTPATNICDKVFQGQAGKILPKLI